MIILNDTLGAFGGSHTMFVRMCEWYRQHNIKVVFICDSRENEEIANKLESLDVKIFVLDTRKINETAALLIKLSRIEEIRVLNFSWDRYLDVEQVKKKYHLLIDNIVYCILPTTFVKGGTFKKNILINGILNSYKRILKKMCDNNAIVMQDEIDIEKTESYYHIKLRPRPDIVRLPMKVDELDREKIIKQGYLSKTIMTGCRADFPFKGYVIGLVDDFLKLKKEFPDTKLLIICDGEDIEQLDKKMKEIPEAYHDSVTYLRWVSYEEIKSKMEQSMLFIGMGSSVLESSLRYKPSIVSRYYTLENLAESFTKDNPNDIEAKENVKTPAYSLIRQVLCMSYDEYRDLSIQSHDVIKDMYGIDMIMDKLMTHHSNNKESILNHSEYFLRVINNKYNEKRFPDRLGSASYSNLSAK